MRQVSAGGRGGQSGPALPPRGSLPYGVGLFSSLLTVVVVLLLGGLLVADRAIVANFHAELERDADASSLAIERFVVEKRGALRDFRGLFAIGAPVTAEAFRSVGSALVAERPGLARLWLETPQREALFDTIYGSLAPASGVLVLSEPLTLDDHLLGYATGVFLQSALAERLDEVASANRRAVVMTSGTDTILRSARSPQTVTGPFGAEVMTQSRILHLPGGPRWRLEVTHSDDIRNTRAALWAVGLLAVSFLAMGLARERRHAARVDERSAELERLSSELLRVNRMKSEFLANVSHELRTPLNALVGFVELLRDGVYGELSPRQSQPVERIAASATHLRHLVDQVLDIAKLAAGRLEVHTESVALRPFVLDVASELEPLMGEKGLTLSLTVGASLPRVRTDPTHLRQVLVNLLGNAVKFTPSGGIMVRARLLSPGSADADSDDATVARMAPDPARHWVAVMVTDTGIGIAPKDHGRIFDEFEQVNAGPRGDSSERGTGLGLPISRRLARLLGGDLTLESDVGRGATFILWLPVDPADLSASARPSPAGVARDSLESQRSPT
jgi:signal transduction histidine kinase